MAGSVPAPVFGAGANNVNVVGSIQDWVAQLLSWLQTNHVDWTNLITDATALFNQCATALADGKLTLPEVISVVQAFVKLMGDLHQQGA